MAAQGGAAAEYDAPLEEAVGVHVDGHPHRAGDLGPRAPGGEEALEVDTTATKDPLDKKNVAVVGFGSAIVQILLLDMVFSIDSIVTAVGMADHVEVMIAAVIVAVGVMFVASGPVARFVADHPTTKMLALAFLLLIGVSLVADGLGFHIPKGYIYAAMGFSVLVEAVNIIAKQRKLNRTGGKTPVAPFTGATGSVAAGAGVAAVKKPSTKSSPTARAQSRPKSAPRKPRTPK